MNTSCPAKIGMKTFIPWMGSSIPYDVTDIETKTIGEKSFYYIHLFSENTQVSNAQSPKHLRISQSIDSSWTNCEIYFPHYGTRYAGEIINWLHVFPLKEQPNFE